MAVDVESAEFEALHWKPTGQLRWFRPKGCSDNEKELQILWERVTGEREWQKVGTCLED